MIECRRGESRILIRQFPKFHRALIIVTHEREQAMVKTRVDLIWRWPTTWFYRGGTSMFNPLTQCVGMRSGKKVRADIEQLLNTMFPGKIEA